MREPADRFGSRQLQIYLKLQYAGEKKKKFLCILMETFVRLCQPEKGHFEGQ